MSVYREYLINYLSVLTNSKFNNISIWDIFAGKGKDDNGNEGSSIIAAKIIEDFRIKKEKNIKLYLNEKNQQFYKSLNSNLQNYKGFTTIYNMDGENLLKQINSFFKNNHSFTKNLFFIDPFGYTEYSTETLKNILQLNNFEYFIFIPTNHIYRFQDADNLENNGAENFLLNLGI